MVSLYKRLQQPKLLFWATEIDVGGGVVQAYLISYNKLSLP